MSGVLESSVTSLAGAGMSTSPLLSMLMMPALQIRIWVVIFMDLTSREHCPRMFMFCGDGLKTAVDDRPPQVVWTVTSETTMENRPPLKELS
jgi:hypothetical protein